MDVFKAFVPWMQEQDSEKKKALWKKMINDSIKPFLERLEQVLSSQDS